MDTYHVVLFVHFLSLFLGFGAAGVIGVCLFRLRAAQTLADAAPFGTLAGQAERVFPVAIIGLFATGAYMTGHVWTWSTHWIEVSIVGLAIVALQGPLLAGRRAHVLKQALQENGPGPLGERAKRMARDPILWIVTFAKPGTAGAIASIVIAYAVGAAVAWPFTKAPAVEAAAAPGAA